MERMLSVRFTWTVIADAFAPTAARAKAAIVCSIVRASCSRIVPSAAFTRTEDVVYGCGGSVQLTTASLTFRCDQRTVAISFVAVSLMQYRPDISKKVRKMDLNWKLKPPHGGGKKNRYFTIVYNEGGTSHAVILQVAPDAMRPYLAEIDLKSGKRVEVRGYESYD